MEETRRQQEESLERREELLRELEMVSQLTQREAHENESKKVARKQELENLVSFLRNFMCQLWLDVILRGFIDIEAKCCFLLFNLTINQGNKRLPWCDICSVFYHWLDVYEPFYLKVLYCVQITARKDMLANEDMELRLELEEEKMAEEDYEEMLRREAAQLSVREFQPKVFWNSLLQWLYI